MENKHISQTTLQKFYNQQVKRLGRSAVDNLKEVQKNSPNKNKRNTVFLCHSHLDKTIVNKMILLFDALDIDLYVDWMDTSMPELTDRNTARIIKEKIDNSSKFIFLATYHALRSKWCNWELGIAYSIKGEQDFAILPINSKTDRWQGNEYLQLYPEMQLGSIDDELILSANNIKINYYNQREIDLETWIRNV